MLTELTIGKQYRVKDYDTLVKERKIYMPNALINASKFNQIANKVVKIKALDRFEYTTYNNKCPVYNTTTIQEWIIFPHEVKECNSLLNIF